MVSYTEIERNIKYFFFFPLRFWFTLMHIVRWELIGMRHL